MFFFKRKNKLLNKNKNSDNVIEQYYIEKNINIPNGQLNLLVMKKNDKCIIDNVFPFSCIYDDVKSGDVIHSINDISLKSLSLNQIKKVFEKNLENRTLKILTK